MPAGSKPGEYRGGRKKGTPNKATQSLRDRIANDYKCDYVGYLCATVNNTVPCAVCRGTGKTKYQSGGGDDPKLRVCQSCWGSKLERIDPKQSAWAAGELMQYCEPKRKAIEHSMDPDAPMPAWRVELISEYRDTAPVAGD